MAEIRFEEGGRGGGGAEGRCHFRSIVRVQLCIVCRHFGTCTLIKHDTFISYLDLKYTTTTVLYESFSVTIHTRYHTSVLVGSVLVGRASGRKTCIDTFLKWPSNRSFGPHDGGKK